MKNWATSNLDPIHLSWPKGLAPFPCQIGGHVGRGMLGSGFNVKPLGPI
jgi:hypothetical protein